MNAGGARHCEYSEAMPIGDAVAQRAPKTASLRSRWPGCSWCRWTLRSRTAQRTPCPHRISCTRPN